jgi:hypothetical protein
MIPHFVRTMRGPNEGAVRSPGAIKVIGKVNGENGYSERTADGEMQTGRAGTWLAP